MIVNSSKSSIFDCQQHCISSPDLRFTRLRIQLISLGYQVLSCVEILVRASTLNQTKGREVPKDRVPCVLNRQLDCNERLEAGIAALYKLSQLATEILLFNKPNRISHRYS